MDDGNMHFGVVCGRYVLCGESGLPRGVEAFKQPWIINNPRKFRTGGHVLEPAS
jgi:hypothetical protein